MHECVLCNPTQCIAGVYEGVNVIMNPLTLVIYLETTCTVHVVQCVQYV